MISQVRAKYANLTSPDAILQRYASEADLLSEVQIEESLVTLLSTAKSVVVEI